MLKQISVIRFGLILSVCLLFAFYCVSAENLLENGDFRELDEDGLPVGWYTDAYIPDPGYTEFTTGEGHTELSVSVEIRNYGYNDARFAQVVDVNPDSLYCLSGYIRADDVEGGHGANLSVEGVYAFSKKIYDTDGQWQFIEYFGKTGPEQNEITVFARLGGYSGESAGKAAFSDLKLVQADRVPEGSVADLWYRESDDTHHDEEYLDDDVTEVPSSVWPWVLAIILACLLSASATIFLMKHCPHSSIIHSVRCAESITLNNWHPDRSLHWKRKDTLILCAVTLIYSLLSLLTLGSTKAPQTDWTSSGTNEQIVFDLGSIQENFEILYFAGVSHHNFSVSVSDNGENWAEETWAQMNEWQCWKWKYITVSYESEQSARSFSNPNQSNIVRFSGRYVRLSSRQYALSLKEILFRRMDGSAISPAVVSQNGANPESIYYSDPSALIDEPETLEQLPALFADEKVLPRKAEPSWWNSTYFDEIYHARTAYEFLQGTVPYETSHPPLGKELMSICIAVFGMTPFGWRFAGAVAGILMLPGMYLLGKQLTKKTWIAALACLLMALDCMHLTQTQIATIDSFPVLFIIFSYFFMLRFLQTDYLQEKTAVSLISLCCSGLCMGLSVASKWIGIYAGAGLAVLFFRHCLRIILLEQKAGKTSRKKRSCAAPRKTLALCLWCIIFFVVIPVTVYLLSYIPYFVYKAHQIDSFSDYIAEVWDTQIHMFRYHSSPGLGMDHDFYSPWWEWPLILRPMYYASEEYVPSSSSVHYSIFCFGNPVIWFGGLAALLCCLIRSAVCSRYESAGSDRIRHLTSTSLDSRYVFLFTGLLAQYLPWVLVPRGTYIYHYFASLPFLMIAVCLCFDGYKEDASKILKSCFILLITAAAGFFILLFPYASGIAVPSFWLDLGQKILNIWY